MDSIHQIDATSIRYKSFLIKVLGPDTAATEEEFRAKIADDLKKHLATDSDKKMRRDISDILLDKLQLELPDELLETLVGSE